MPNARKDSTMTTFRDRLSERIKAAGISVTDLAERSGIGRQMLYDILGERRNPDKQLNKLAGVEEMNTSEYELEAWMILDRYHSASILEAAAVLAVGVKK